MQRIGINTSDEYVSQKKDVEKHMSVLFCERTKPSLKVKYFSEAFISFSGNRKVADDGSISMARARPANDERSGARGAAALL